jgi:hypothetical protein
MAKSAAAMERNPKLAHPRAPAFASAEEDAVMLTTLVEGELYQSIIFCRVEVVTLPIEELEENEGANATYYDTCSRDVYGFGDGDASYCSDQGSSPLIGQDGR